MKNKRILGLVLGLIVSVSLVIPAIAAPVDNCSNKNQNNIITESKNLASQKCNIPERVYPNAVEYHTEDNTATCSKTCKSTCVRWGDSECLEYSKGVCSCSNFNGCAYVFDTCTYGNGSGCTASATSTSTIYSVYSHWTASDGRTMSSVRTSCERYPEITTYTFPKL